jgi:hypothetical protein
LPASIRPDGRTGFRNGDTNGHTHEVVKEAVMDSRFSLLASLVLLCALIALGPTTTGAARIGAHLRFMRKTFRGRLQGDTTRMSAWKRRRHRD